MQNDSSFNEGREGANDERKAQPLASTLPINRDLPLLPPPPPPSLDPSSSSSSTHHDTSQLLGTSSLEAGDMSIPQLSSLVRQLVSNVGQLRSENEAQASSIARLSSENETFKKINKDQELVIGELSRAAVPGGFWVWESRTEQGREVEGRWVWSLEKYKVLPPVAVAAGPPASLLSLPVELLSLILDLLGRDEWLVLCEVSFRLLELTSERLYGRILFLDPDEAYNFVESRAFHPAPTSERVTSLLLPRELQFCGPPVVDQFKDVIDLASSLSSPLSLLCVEILAVKVIKFEEATPWMDLIRFVDPTAFQLWIGNDHDLSLPPTIRRVPLDFVFSFSSHWTQLDEVSFLGPGSVLLVEGTEGTSAFDDCLRRCCPSSALPRQLWTKMLDGKETRETVQARDISSVLGRSSSDDGFVDLVSLDLTMVLEEEDEES